MKLVRFFLKGVLLAYFTFIGTMIFGFVLWRLGLTSDYSMELHPPSEYLLMLPAICFSILCSKRTNSLKEAFLEGFGLAAVQFGLLIAFYASNPSIAEVTGSSGIAGALKLPEVYLMSIGIFIGPLLNYLFNKVSKSRTKESI